MRLSCLSSYIFYTGFLFPRVIPGVKAQTAINISATVQSFINATTLADGLLIKYLADGLDHHSVADGFPNASLPNIQTQLEVLLVQLAAHASEIKLEQTQSNTASENPLNCNPDYSALITNFGSFAEGLLYTSATLGATINGQIVSAAGDPTFAPFVNVAIAHTALYSNIVTIAQQLVVGPGFSPWDGLLSAPSVTLVEANVALGSFLGTCSFDTTGTVSESDINPVVFTPTGDASGSLLSSLIVKNDTRITVDTTQLAGNCDPESTLFCQYIMLQNSIPNLGTGVLIQPLVNCTLLSEGVTVLYVTKDDQQISPDLTDRFEQPQPSNSCAGPTIVYVNGIAGLEQLVQQNANIEFADE